MSNKKTFKKVAAVFLGLAMTVGATGCDFFTVDNQKDLNQDVATVNINNKLKKDDLGTVLGYLSTNIKKRELVSYYLSTGYQYVEQYGYSYADTFNMLLDGLVSREVMIQYAINYYLTDADADEKKTADGCETFINNKINNEKDATLKSLYEENKDVLVFEYFLTHGDDTKNYDKAVYSLKKSLNSSLDSLEASYITASEEEHNHEEARTLPTGVDTEKTDYYTTDYAVYTGRNQSNECGEYEVVEGSTRTSRQKAYNAFLTNIQAYNLIDEDEDTRDVTKISYYYVELKSVLGQALINQYFESMEDAVSKNLDADYLTTKYTETYNKQAKDYTADTFASALDSAAAGSYNLYGLEGYGYVYNLLIPFSTSQSVKYSEAKSRGLTEDQLFAERRAIAEGIVAKDLRDSWISEHDHANYSYEENGKTYFFKDNLSENPKYELLDHYAGKYAYTKETTKIDGFMKIFEDYIAEISGATVTGAKNPNYATTIDFNGTNNKMDHDEYANFTYYAGKVELDSTAPSNYFKRDSQQYKALSAVNELIFAYGTDPGAFNSYMGYKVSPQEGSTGFVKEFEWAAQEVVKAGVGSYAVCLTDYGWHILYCSFVYNGGDVYGGYNHAERETEGTFSNLYYETMKEAAFSSYATETQTRLIREYDNETTGCVERIEKNYKDLLEMDN